MCVRFVFLFFLTILSPIALATSPCGRYLDTAEERLIILIDLAESGGKKEALRFIAERVFRKPAFHNANEAAEEFILATQKLKAPELLSTFLIHNIKMGRFRPSEKNMKLILQVAQSEGMEDSLMTLIDVFPPQSTADLLKFFIPVDS